MSFSRSHLSKLALNIIEEHFGDVTRLVAAFLLKSDNATLGYIVRHFATQPGESRLNARQIRQAMLVLQQHNCLLVELPDEVDVEGDAPSVAADRLKQKGLIYGLNLEMVVNRLRFPKIFKIAKDMFGDSGIAVLEGILIFLFRLKFSASFR